MKILTLALAAAASVITFAAGPRGPGGAGYGPLPEPASARAATAAQKERLKVAGSTQQKKLVHVVRPEYPPEAKEAGITGIVKLRVIIDTEGAVREIDVLEGHELLVPPTLTAVRQWRWEPTLLNGEPVEVVTDVNVNFTLPK